MQYNIWGFLQNNQCLGEMSSSIDQTKLPDLIIMEARLEYMGDLLVQFYLLLFVFEMFLSIHFKKARDTCKL